jgi:hypothetical protein
LTKPIHLSRLGSLSQIKLHFDLATAGNYGVRTWEYWNGSVWATLTIDQDDTSGFTQDGDVAFTAPADWKTGTVNDVNDKFWVRVRVASVTSAATVYQVQINVVWLCIMVDPNFSEAADDYNAIAYSATLLQQEAP